MKCELTWHNSIHPDCSGWWLAELTDNKGTGGRTFKASGGTPGRAVRRADRQRRRFIRHKRKFHNG